MAKLSGTPYSLIITWLAVGTRARRSSRSAHERRAWARCARERITSARQSEVGTGGGMLTSIRWCRTSCLQARRCSLRLQSREAAAARDQPEEDGATRSPASVSSWHFPPIDEAFAKGRGDNCGCWPHTLPGGFHRLLYVVRAQPAIDQRDSALFRPAGGQSPAQRSGQL